MDQENWYPGKCFEIVDDPKEIVITEELGRRLIEWYEKNKGIAIQKQLDRIDRDIFNELESKG